MPCLVQKGSGLFRKDTGFGSIQEIPSQYQPGSPSNADAHPLQQGYLQYESPDRDTQSIRRTASYQAVTHTEPEQLAAKSHLPRATSEQLAAESELAQPAQLSTDLCQTCNSWRYRVSSTSGGVCQVMGLAAFSTRPFVLLIAFIVAIG